MKTAIILHGMPSKEEYFNPESEAQSNKHWLPWIQRQLILKGVLAQALELPEPYEPVYEKWRATFEQMHVDAETILIGHSCGAGFLARWLSENKIETDKVALIAPFLDPDKVAGDFFNFSVNPALPSRTKGLHIFISTDDDEEITTSTALLTSAWPEARVHQFSDRGHFTFGDMGTVEFPELRDALIS